MKLKKRLMAYIGHPHRDTKVIEVTSTHLSLLNLTSENHFVYHREFTDVLDDNGKIIEKDHEGQVILYPYKCTYINGIAKDSYVTFKNCSTRYIFDSNDRVIEI